MKALLQQLCPVFGPSGREEGVIALIESMVSPYADSLQRDALGSLMALKKGRDSSHRLMIAAHADEIGLIVTQIDPYGFLAFSAVGGVSVNEKAGGTRVRFENGTVGVIQKRAAKGDSPAKEADLFIDIGAASREAALRLVSPGDFAVFHGETLFQGDFCISKALDNRVGCAAAVKAFQSLGTPAYDTYFVWTTQEEVGARGAATAAYCIHPTWALAVDTTLVGDNPQALPVAMECGRGVAVKVRDKSLIVPKKWVERLLQAADDAGIPHQMEVLPFGGTDAGAIQLTRNGVLSGTLSIPTRYVHTASEMVHLGDARAAEQLIEAVCSRSLE